MKKVLFGLMVLTSLSVFADDQAFVGEHGEKQAVCEPCEARKRAELEQKQREAGKDLATSGGQKKSGGKASASKQ